jgi:hypothetical protein
MCRQLLSGDPLSYEVGIPSLQKGRGGTEKPHSNWRRDLTPGSRTSLSCFCLLVYSVLLPAWTSPYVSAGA